MSKRERNWLVELRLVAEGKEKLKDAQAKLGGSYRNAKRRLSRLREEGDAGLVHKSRGRPSNRAKPGQVKELVLHKITTAAQANSFLEGGYLESLNQKFARVPASETDYHRPIPGGEEIQASLAIKETRTVGNDWTVRHNNRLYQITGPNHHLPPAKGTVTVRQRLDGSLHMYYRNHEVRFNPIASRPAPPKTAPARTGHGPSGSLRPTTRGGGASRRLGLEMARRREK